MNKEKLVPESDYKDICKSCRGKGYSTNWHGIEGAEDLGLEAFSEAMQMHIEYCACSRGQQLQKLIKQKQAEAQLMILRRVYFNFKNRRKRDMTKWLNFDSIANILKGYWKGIMREVKTYYA